MTLFLSFVLALFVSVALMPALIRYAEPLQLLDPPSPRKVHTNPIPRCGGVALAIATILAIAFWIELDRSVLAYFIGLATITLVGVWDDRVELHYLPKLIAQFFAAGALVAGGLTLSHLPFLGLDPVHPVLGAAVTMIFVVAVTNAINLSDGLDGLAAGSVLITLAIIALLALPGEPATIFLIVAALTGGIFGFLRFNTHPAQVFLGDGGSYFLGFSVAALCLMLGNDANPALSPAIILLVPGLPLLDLVWVTLERLLSRKSPFTADSSHFHHKLLELNLNHHEAVVLYYILHALLGLGAFVLAYEADTTVVLIFGAAALALLSAYYWSAHKQLRFSRPVSDILGKVGPAKRTFLVNSRYFDLALALGFTSYLGLALLQVGTISNGIASLPLILAGLVALSLLRKQLSLELVTRFSIHIVTIVVVYLSTGQTPFAWYPIAAQYAHLAILLALLALSMRSDAQNRFRLTSFDSLLILVAVVSPIVTQRYLGDFPANRIRRENRDLALHCRISVSR